MNTKDVLEQKALSMLKAYITHVFIDEMEKEYEKDDSNAYRFLKNAQDRIHKDVKDKGNEVLNMIKAKLGKSKEGKS